MSSSDHDVSAVDAVSVGTAVTVGFRRGGKMYHVHGWKVGEEPRGGGANVGYKRVEKIGAWRANQRMKSIRIKLSGEDETWRTFGDPDGHYGEFSFYPDERITWMSLWAGSWNGIPENRFGCISFVTDKRRRFEFGAKSGPVVRINCYSGVLVGADIRAGADVNSVAFYFLRESVAGRFPRWKKLYRRAVERTSTIVADFDHALRQAFHNFMRLIRNKLDLSLIKEIKSLGADQPYNYNKITSKLQALYNSSPMRFKSNLDFLVTMLETLMLELNDSHPCSTKAIIQNLITNHLRGLKEHGRNDEVNLLQRISLQLFNPIGLLLLRATTNLIELLTCDDQPHMNMSKLLESTPALQKGLIQLITQLPLQQSSRIIFSNRVIKTILTLREQIFRHPTSTFLHRTQGWLYQLTHSEGYENEKKKGDKKREKFLKRSNFRAPDFLRIIDVQASWDEKKVVLIPWDTQNVDTYKGGYAAISHTYGMEVYDVYNCPCVSICRDGVVPRGFPECRGHDGVNNSEYPKRVTKDVLERVSKDMIGMCRTMLDASIPYVWHDGVCIKQYKEKGEEFDEVKYFIGHMGWIYASAIQTVAFLHYIAKPMFPIGPKGSNAHDLTSRWDTRAWTYQEAVLSRKRQYCVPREWHNFRNVLYQFYEERSFKRLPTTFNDFQSMMSNWFQENAHSLGDGCIIDEFSFILLIDDLFAALATQEPPEGFDSLSSRITDASNLLVWIISTSGYNNSQLSTNGYNNNELSTSGHNTSELPILLQWLQCLCGWMHLLEYNIISFPSSTRVAMEVVSRRASKHEGDRMNSVLGLLGVKDFVADKDNNLEENTIKFFEKMGRKGLAIALFSANLFKPKNLGWSNTWVPTFSFPLQVPNFFGEEEDGYDKSDIMLEGIDFDVVEYEDRPEKNLQIMGSLICIHANFFITSKPGQMNQLVTNCGKEQLNLELHPNLQLATSLVGDPKFNIVGNTIISLDSLEGQLLEGDIKANLLRYVNDTLGVPSTTPVNIITMLCLPVMDKLIVTNDGALHFVCSMVIPRKTLMFDAETIKSSTFPVLLVQDSTKPSEQAYISKSYSHDSPVVKIGSFVGNQNLKNHILDNLELITCTLDSLLLK